MTVLDPRGVAPVPIAPETPAAPPPMPEHGAAATPNQLLGSGPGSPAYAEWHQQHEHAQREMADRARIADQQRQNIDTDRWSIVLPVWEAEQAAAEQRAPRTPITRAQLAELGAVAGAGVALWRGLGRREPMQLLGDVLLAGVCGGVGGYVVGDMVLALIEPGTVRPASLVMPPRIAHDIHRRLGGHVEPWRWAGIIQSWSDFSASHNAAHGIGAVPAAGATPRLDTAVRVAGLLASSRGRRD
jgi:hypothetical protein